MTPIIIQIKASIVSIKQADEQQFFQIEDLDNGTSYYIKGYLVDKSNPVETETSC